MNKNFIQNSHISTYYELKEGTQGSFLFKAGKPNSLPNRISWGMYSKSKKSPKLEEKINEINATYKIAEEGLYKELFNRKIHTAIWPKKDFPEFYGYGVIDERTKTKDLLIIFSEDQCSESLEIHIFRGMGKPEYFDMAFEYLRNEKAPRKRA